MATITMPPTNTSSSQTNPLTGGTTARVACMLVPTSRMFATVPTPGRWRSGIHSSSTRNPTMLVIHPIPTPVCSDRPWANTVHGSSPMPARTMTAQPAP